MATRAEAAEYLHGAFGTEPSPRGQAISAAELQGASHEALATLGQPHGILFPPPRLMEVSGRCAAEYVNIAWLWPDRSHPFRPPGRAAHPRRHDTLIRTQARYRGALRTLRPQKRI